MELPKESTAPWESYQVVHVIQTGAPTMSLPLQIDTRGLTGA
jgi:hypothetical protein